MSWDPELERAFHPNSIAIVGASSAPAAQDQQWGGGNQFIRYLQDLSFAGRIYPVNPKATTIRGLQAYPSVSAIPEPVDLVIITVPAPIAPLVLEDCIHAGARNIHMFTSGYGEVGDEEGRRRELQVAEIARRGGLRIIGPNCMGLHVPAARISTMNGQPAGPGPVALVSQSGGHANFFIRHFGDQGIGLSKVISFGNGLVLESCDFLEYLAQDPETRIICMYIEGVKQGRRLFELVREVNPRKPVLIWKGGLSQAGAGAAASHTGSLAGAPQVWEAFFRQTGAVPVKSVDEMADVVRLFLHMAPLTGRRACVIGGGGGNSVAWADICNSHGLEVPALQEGTRALLRRYVPPAGNGIRNPLDAAPLLRDLTALRQAMELVAADPNIDLFILNSDFQMGSQPNPEALEKLGSFLIDFAHSASGKPVVGVLDTANREVLASTAKLVPQLQKGGVPVFSTLPRAARSLNSFVSYHLALRQSQDAQAGPLPSPGN